MSKELWGSPILKMTIFLWEEGILFFGLFSETAPWIFPIFVHKQSLVLLIQKPCVCKISCSWCLLVSRIPYFEAYSFFDILINGLQVNGAVVPRVYYNFDISQFWWCFERSFQICASSPITYIIIKKYHKSPFLTCNKGSKVAVLQQVFKYP